MHVRHDPANVHAPVSPYSHGIESRGSLRWLHVSGQVGVRADGTPAAGIGAQVEQAFENLRAVLASAGMEPADLVKLTAYLVRREDLVVYREARNRFVGEARPASTLVLVAGLASPEWLVEVEAVAARG